MTIATLAEVKAILGLADTESDARITAMLGGVSSMVEKFTRRAWSNASASTISSGGDRALLLSRYPITSVETITDRHSGFEVSSDQYRIDAPNGMVYRLPWGAYWATMGDSSPFGGDSASAQNIPRWQVEYTGGPDSAPDDVKMAFAEIISSLMKSSGGISSEKDGDYSYSISNSMGIPPSAAFILKSNMKGFG